MNPKVPDFFDCIFWIKTYAKDGALYSPGPGVWFDIPGSKNLYCDELNACGTTVKTEVYFLVCSKL